ncbi:MAG: carboxypeptidase regulatory-like domain-containing protein [Gammaproteobacteria bacterium]|nr:carboxypeptidase regulatory-like domain-containing protein [Gammaproteobacteria bacterium]
MTSGSIPAQTLSVGESVRVDVAQYFREPDDEALTYGATSSDAQVATVGVSASIVTVSGESSGQANVSVSAMDPHGATAEQSFTVTVDASDRAPVPSGSIPAQSVPRGESVRLELAQYFSDPDDDPLTYGATSSNTHVATVTIEETTAIITAENLGRSNIRVTARDPEGETATQLFSVTVEAPAFTLSGAVRDRRRNGPVLAGAVVRLDNGQRESTRTDRDGRYRFRNVSGTVTVTATAAPSYVAETVEVTMDRDRNADFALRHTGRPPFEGTVWITPDILGPSDPTSFRSVTYRGRGIREFWDRRTNRWVRIDVYLFNVQYAGRQSEFQVHPEFGSREAARSEVDTYAPALGRLPAALLSGVREVEVSAVDALLQGNEAGIVHIYTGNAEELIRNGFLEEVLFHEGGHASLDRSHKNSAGWRTAQQEDGVFISTYARDHPVREDVAESILPYFAVRYRPERLTDADRSAILSAIPNRLVYFDERRLNMSPYNATGTLVPVLEPSSFQPRRISQPFEGPPTR